MREALKFVGGSFAVYVVMAACAGKSPTPNIGSLTPPAVAGMSAVASNGGAPGAGGLVAQAGDVNGPGQMGASGQAEGTGGSSQSGKAGSGPRDAGMMDAIAGAMGDPVPDAAAQEMSGSRLKARYLVGEDGSKQWNYGWYDTKRKENCTFSTALDGTERCIPTAGASSSGSYFGDEGCMTEVTMVTTACGAALPQYVSRSVLGSCNTYETSLHQLGSPISSASYYIKSGTSCLGVTLPNGFALYTIGDEVAADSFAQATEQVDQ